MPADLIPARTIAVAMRASCGAHVTLTRAATPKGTPMAKLSIDHGGPRGEWALLTAEQAQRVIDMLAPFVADNLPADAAADAAEG